MLGRRSICLALVCCAGLMGCATPRPRAEVLFASLDDGPTSPTFLALSEAFATANPGYYLNWYPELRSLATTNRNLVLFVQTGSATAIVRSEGGEQRALEALASGDVVLLRPSDELQTAAPLGVLVFDVPVALPAALPTFVRPDWDPGITDTPGGCAEETGAYRRILLTWLAENGPYVYHALNAHRVRITDSFSHYHPVDGGFDEFYLVQMVQPGAQLITSHAVAQINNPGAVTRSQAAGLLEYHALAANDLVYLPRGTMHRGLGGVLAQVITAPGFRPGAEIGVDHELNAINERLGLQGAAALPVHAAAAQSGLVK